jgi:nitroimidazol reductase NimA-like FMN-containing flavoprotein (pyridoxamine 5'-phosphate oxidase superfamily)
VNQQQPDEDRPVVELTEEECWALLADGDVGRLAYRLVDEIHLVPVNYGLDGRNIVFRTAPGSKLLAAELHSAVAFEIDWYGETAAWSVVVRGRIRHLGEDEESRLDSVAPRSWIPTLKYDYVELTPESVSGRRFMLRR